MYSSAIHAGNGQFRGSTAVEIDHIHRGIGTCLDRLHIIGSAHAHADAEVHTVSKDPVGV